ncbi:hypothetical protein ACHAQJ_001860 [Trichoderma viride]
MFVKSTASAGLLMALVNFAAASPVALKRDTAAAPSKAVLTPAGSSGSNLALATQDNFIWTHEAEGLYANLTVKANQGVRLLSALNFQDVVESVDCTTQDVTVTFDSASSFKAAQSAWGWVNQAASNTIIYVAEGDACAGDIGRQPFSVESIKYDSSANTATLAATKAAWKSFAEDASIHITGTPTTSTGNKARDVSENVPIDISHDFSGQIYSTTIDGVNLGISCSTCNTQGTLDADITLSFSNGFEASVTTQNNLGATFEVSFTAGGAISSPLSTSIPIYSVALAGFSIEDVVDIGPQLNVVADATLSGFSASATATVGVEASLPDGSGFTLGQSANISPVISATGLSMSGSVSVAANITPQITLQLAATFFDEGLIGGIVLQAPQLSATFAGAASTAGESACGSSDAEVSVEVDVGVELDAFGGFGSSTDQPNKAKVFSTSETLWKACLVV